MSHPAKNYSRPPPRQGMPTLSLSLCFRKEGSRTLPFCQKHPWRRWRAQRPRGPAESMGGGVEAQQGKGLVPHALIRRG